MREYGVQENLYARSSLPWTRMDYYLSFFAVLSAVTAYS